MEAEEWWLKLHTPQEVYESDQHELTEEEKIELAEMRWERENDR